MGWEVKKIIRGQTKHGLWGSNLKTEKICTMVAVRIEFVFISFSFHFHMHSNIDLYIYHMVTFLAWGFRSGAGGRGRGELLKNLTCPILV